MLVLGLSLAEWRSTQCIPWVFHTNFPHNVHWKIPVLIAFTKCAEVAITCNPQSSEWIVQYLFHFSLQDISKRMAVWFGWMSGPCLHDIFICSHLHYSFRNHFSGKVLDYQKISHQTFLFQKRKKVLLNILGSLIYWLSFSVTPLAGWSSYGLEETIVTFKRSAIL